jgi:hypothetical protein
MNKIDRTSETGAAEIVERMFPSPSVRMSCCRVLAECIECAHQCSPVCWEATLFKNRVRLNVGQVLVAQFAPQSVLSVVDTREVTGEAREAVSKWRLDVGEWYKFRSLRFPHSCIFLPPDKLEVVYPLLRDAHESCIRAASGKGGKTRFSSAFSPGIVLYLRGILGRPVPFPAYACPETPDYLPQEPFPYSEGDPQEVTSTRYERDPAARAECLRHHGTSCSVCNFDFGRVFGPAGQGLIHVHHLHALSQAGEEHKVDPKTDMIPVCPNCHAMIHHRNPP